MKRMQSNIEDSSSKNKNKPSEDGRAYKDYISKSKSAKESIEIIKNINNSNKNEYNVESTIDITFNF